MIQIADRLRDEIEKSKEEELTLPQKRHRWSYFCGYMDYAYESGTLSSRDWIGLHTLLAEVLEVPKSWGW